MTSQKTAAEGSGAIHGSDPRFVRYYEQESLSPGAVERFRVVRDKVLSLAARARKDYSPLSVLDIGCGAGTQCFLYAELGHSVVGIDINAPLIEVAKKRARTANITGEFHLGSAAALPFEDGSFDVCLLNELLEHVPEWQRCLDEATRVLKPEGILYVSTTNYLCPRQQEFELPLYSWYPAVVKRRCEELARTTKPQWANFATYPAVNWFSYWKLKKYLAGRGMSCLDRFDLMDEASVPRLMRPALTAVRKLGVFRLLAYTLVSGSIVYGIKREHAPSRH
jgi:2-polyprenyl-6-hydroxyphenyl methylase/3-demethylubiquinone-9 3-methyltransferase